MVMLIDVIWYIKYLYFHIINIIIEWYIYTDLSKLILTESMLNKFLIIIIKTFIVLITYHYIHIILSILIKHFILEINTW